MISINGIEVKMEGDFKTLISEVVRAMHSVAKSAQEQFNEKTDGEVNYDHVIEMILTELVQYRKMDDQNGSSIPDEILESFHEQLVTERKANRKKPKAGFIDYDTRKPDEQKNKVMLQEIIKGVYNDPRSSTLDIEDLKAIKKSQKKR